MTTGYPELTELAMAVWPHAVIEIVPDGVPEIVVWPDPAALDSVLRIEHARCAEATEAALRALAEGEQPSRAQYADAMRRCMALEGKVGALQHKLARIRGYADARGLSDETARLYIAGVLDDRVAQGG